MPSAWRPMTYFALSLPHQPGELGRFADDVAESGINLLGLWGYAEGQEEPRLSIVPESADDFRRFASGRGLKLEEGRTYYLCARDRPGALVATLRMIADMGINIEAIESVASGDEFGCFIWTDEAHWEELEQVLV